jgi:hypothetical protein
MALLYFVFALHENDILNCRMVTYDRQKAETESLVVLRNTGNCWCRIMSFPSTLKTGTRIWVTLEDPEDGTGFTDVRIMSVDEDETMIPQNGDWTEDMVIV